MSNSLAIALGVRKKNKAVASAKPMMESMEYEEGIEESAPAQPMEEIMPKRSIMMSKGGIAKAIMSKKAMNQGDNMPVNDDTDNFSAETSMEGPLGEGMAEDAREDKIMVRKSMLDRIMSRLHSDNKGE